MRISDWSSDVCSSDLFLAIDTRVQPHALEVGELLPGHQARNIGDLLHAGITLVRAPGGDRQSVVSGKSVSVRVDIGGRRIIKITRKTVSSKPYMERSRRLNKKRYKNTTKNTFT